MLEETTNAALKPHALPASDLADVETITVAHLACRQDRVERVFIALRAMAEAARVRSVRPH